MKFFLCGTAQDFQQELAAMLGLAPNCGDTLLREALSAIDPQYLPWYEARMQAFAEPAKRGVRNTVDLH